MSYMFHGIDYEDALSEISREAVQSAYERTITEALMSHPCTERIHDFVFEWESDSVAIFFTVKPKFWPSFDISMNVVN